MNIKTIILIIAGLIVLAGLFGFMLLADSKDKVDTGDEGSSVKTYDIGGVECTKKQNIDVYYFMGLDSTSDASSVEDDPDHSIQNDVNILLVIDRAKNTYTTLTLNRDTLVLLDIPSESGETTEMIAQLALANAYGSDETEGCLLAKFAVSRLLYDQKINGYMALNMDAIGKVNNILGGVTVTIEDDFNDDSGLKNGETVKLTDQQAEAFVRGRKSVGDGTNENRMARQQAFMDAAKPLFIEKCKADNSFAVDAVKQLDGYTVTDISNSQFSKIAKAFIKDEEVKTPEIKGNRSVNENTGFVEVELDQDSLDKTVIDLFYEPVDEFEYEMNFGE